MNLPLILALFGAATAQRLTPAENQQLQSICGTLPKESSRRLIYGGIPVSGETAPFAIKINFDQELCSGTIISPRHILTARHCIDRNPSRDNIVQKTDCSGADQVHSVNSQIIWPRLANDDLMPTKVTKLFVPNGCVADYQEDDMLIVELNTDIHFSATAHPACILKDTNGVNTYSEVSLYSYGSTAFDRRVAKGHGQLQQGIFRIEGAIRNGKQLHLDDPTDKFAARPGDSGGGYIRKLNGKSTLVAVHSSGADNPNLQYAPFLPYYNKSICEHTGVC